AGGVSVARDDVQPGWLTGGLALVSSAGPVGASPPERTPPRDRSGGLKPGTQRGGNVRFWFRDWRVAGSRVVARDERAFGPILFTLYTVSRGVLKLTAQMAPVDDESRPVALRVRGKTHSAAIDPAASTATFRIEDWDESRAAPYQVVYDGQTYRGTIQRNPQGEERIIAGALTCQNDFGFPHQPIVRHVRAARPHILFFTGDQLYERNAEYGIQRSPPPTARLDYLRKWFLFGWAFGELTRDIPTVCMPDDHDVYHGNLWGAGGRAATGAGQPGQDSGGYTMPADWVNMVQRTQTSHLPDPPDSAPAGQGIGVWFCHLAWGGVSFAILEDRKFKSPPKEFLSNAAIVNGWPQNPNYDAARDGDAAGAQLLGERQERFLAGWARDWAGGIWMKAAVSATIFNNLATLPVDAKNDSVTPMLEILKPGEYPSGDRPVMDHDSNAWPQSGRNRALREMRRCLAVHIAGDQHLASTIQYGIDEWNDGPFALCTPAISNIFPRRWFPPQPGRNPKPHGPRNTGEYRDGFGNRMTVHAVANPELSGIEPRAVNDRVPGFGLVEFRLESREIALASNARHDGRPYPGWPITIRQTDAGGGDWKLDEVETPGIADPVVEVTEQATGEVVAVWRIRGSRVEPRVRRAGRYTVRCYDPERRFERVFRDLEARQ
ncbi:MAG: alkaline phosphatase D family protein, partial [Bryobacteraceae bacterium]